MEHSKRHCQLECNAHAVPLAFFYSIPVPYKHRNAFADANAQRAGYTVKLVVAIGLAKPIKFFDALSDHVALTNGDFQPLNHAHTDSEWISVQDSHAIAFADVVCLGIAL